MARMERPETRPTQVITYLAMDAPPAHAPLAKPLPTLTIVHARRPTLAFYRFLYDTVGAPWAWTDRQRMDQARLAELVASPETEVHVLYDDGVPTGYAELDKRRLPEIELAYFGIMPEQLGKRLGPYLLDWIVRHAWSLAPSRLVVNTCNFDHPRALPLYERLGFVVERRTEGPALDLAAVLASAPLRARLSAR
jgi:GNAT superfamily N-acetyltransferase